jgi:hypothetical protein
MLVFIYILIYFKRAPDGNLSFILVYVDDLLIVARVISEIEWGKELLKKDFTIHDLGEVHDFLGCQVLKNRVEGTISMSCTPKMVAFPICEILCIPNSQSMLP